MTTGKDEHTGETTRGIEITFPVAVELTNDDQRQLDAVAGEICDRYKRAHPGRVMWPAGLGHKILYMPMTREEELAGKHMEFDESVFSIDCYERADYDWLCAKCGIKQGDHVDYILEPPAGDCEFEPVAKEPEAPIERGLVPMRVYLMAVNGRREMRAEIKSLREELAQARADLSAAKGDAHG